MNEIAKKPACTKPIDLMTFLEYWKTKSVLFVMSMTPALLEKEPPTQHVSTDPGPQNTTSATPVFVETSWVQTRDFFFKVTDLHHQIAPGLVS